MKDGKEFNIRNPVINSIKEWIRISLMPQGIQVLWYEILPNVFIQVSQIQEIKELSEEEVENLNKPEIVEQEDSIESETLKNEEMQKK